jgi:hypothetical protein
MNLLDELSSRPISVGVMFIQHTDGILFEKQDWKNDHFNGAICKESTC